MDFLNIIIQLKTIIAKKIFIRNSIIMIASERKLIKKLRQAINDFWMIEPSDTLILGISWWKDSMVLAHLINRYRRIIKDKFNVRAVYISKDFLWEDIIKFEEKKKYFDENFDFTLEKIEIKLPHDSKLKEWLWTDCQRCAYARRIALMKTCQNFWANKIVLWHHMDDIVVTSMLNMIEWRNLKVMPPINKMRKWDITFIRPMSYIREKEIQYFIDTIKIPYSDYKCPIWENTMRNKIKREIVRENEKKIHKYTENIFWSMIKDFKEKYEDIWYSM